MNKQTKTQEHQQNNEVITTDIKENGLADAPLTRYFQIHFQHIHDNARNVQAELTLLKQHVADLNVKLDQLTAMLIGQQTIGNLSSPYFSTPKNKEH